ncbi:MAG: hypothetical protein LUE22_03050 [Oscillospiraceae bacterium]|nr:hypothetical protein [Oscillospiraceae bacterium]
MDSMEQSRITEWLGKIKEKLSKVYKQENFGERTYFVNQHGTPFMPFAFPGRFALGIEYADSKEDAVLGRFEDGDLFYIEDYVTVDDLFRDMFQEIEG